MRGGAERLGRLLAIRRLKEEIERGTVRTAMAAVAEVESSLIAMEGALKEEKSAGEAALHEGRSNDWLMADVQRRFMGLRHTEMKQTLADRSNAASLAMKMLLECSREYEQVKRLVENAEQAARTDEVRRAQQAADEWFLSKPLNEL